MVEIQKQTIFEDVEFLFIETASPEKERELIFPYTQKYENIKLITTEDRRSLYQAWNMGWQEAQAKLICYSNMDDALHPECLQKVSETMESEPDVDICSVMIARQHNGSPGEVDSFDSKRLRKLTIGRRPGPFSAWRTNLKNKIGMFNEDYLIISDMEFWTRIADAKLNAKLIRKVLYLYSIADTQLSKGGGRRKEHQDISKKGVHLRWDPKITKSILWHRKLFLLIPGKYLP